MLFVRSVVLLIAGFLMSAGVLSAQSLNITGKWYGIATVNANSNNYLSELILVQKGNKVTGEFNYYFRNGYFSNKIEGTFNNSTRRLMINMLPIMYFGTIETENGVDCRMEGEFTLKVSRAESTLSGMFTSDKLYAYSCPPINVTFTKQLKEPPPMPLREMEDMEIAKTTNTDDLKPAETPTQKLEREATTQLNMRLKEIVKELEVSEDSVRIDLYDNGEYDHDSITVFYNNKVVQYKQELQTNKPISFYVHIDSIASNNDLVMFAENLGLIPPNSALMIITDKNHRYEVNLESNYLKNAAVRLRKKAASNNGKGK